MALNHKPFGLSLSKPAFPVHTTLRQAQGERPYNKKHDGHADKQS